MRITFQKLNIAIATIEGKYAAWTGDLKSQQDAVEKIVLLHTQMRVEKEQNINKLLFSNL